MELCHQLDSSPWFIDPPVHAAPLQVPSSSSQGQTMCQEDDSQPHSTQFPPMNMSFGWDGDSVRAGNFSAKEINPAVQKSGVSLGEVCSLQVDVIN